MRTHDSRKARCAFLPAVWTMEERVLLSTVAAAGQPTDDEQYILELVNLARANPTAMGKELYALRKQIPRYKPPLKAKT